MLFFKDMAVEYTFTPLDKKFSIFSDKRGQELLMKWNLKDNLILFSMSYNEIFSLGDIQIFIRQLLNVPMVRKILSWTDLYKNKDISLTPISCSIMSRNFFDRISDQNNLIVFGDGQIRGCFEEVVDGFYVNDELRQLLINNERDGYSLYSVSERQELLFRILLHLVIGGKWCQYEYDLQPYLDIAVVVYKDLVRVQKNSLTNELEIRSKCFQIQLPMKNGTLQDFVYISIDPVLREATIFAHKFN